MAAVIISLLQCASEASGQTSSSYFIRGIVRDSLTNEGLPYASVQVEGRKISALTDNSGVFEMNIPEGSGTLVVSCMGYRNKSVPVRRTSLNLYDIYLSPASTELDEVVVRKKKYSKKNNPAVEFAERLRRQSDLTDPFRNDYYNYDSYEKISLGLNDFDATPDGSALLRKFPFLIEHIDTSEVSGKPVLNLSLKEKATEMHYRRDPKALKYKITGLRSNGIDEIVSQANIQTFLDDVLREVDLYQNDINILQNRFVSPLSRIATDFYKFYLVDTVEVDNERCVMLAFYPHNKSTFGFNGHVYVPVGDTTMFIKKVDMTVPRDINLNFIDNLSISQSFEKAPDNSRLKMSDDLVLEISVIPGTQSLYARRSVAYSNHNFEPAADSLYSFLGESRIEAGAYSRDDNFWSDARTIRLADGEQNAPHLLERLRAVPAYYWGEKILKIIFTGYVQTGRNSKFDIGPVNTFISYNALEGVRLRLGGMTTANLSPRWFARGYAAYGCRDHRWKYSGEVEYSFHDKTYHSREFPVHSLRLTHSYDVDRLGQHYLFTSPDNFVLSLKRLSDNRDTYLRTTRLDYTLELHNNFSVEASVASSRQEATEYVPFTEVSGRKLGYYTQNTFKIQLRYAPGEKFVQSKTNRIPINLDAPVFVLSHTYSPKGFLGSRYEINKTEFNMSKRFWLSAFGFIDIYAGGGHVWSSSPFPELLIPNANLSYTIQPQSFALMNPMEFINSSYVSWDCTYWLNGLIFNYIPYVKKLKLREVVGFRGLYGTLSRRNTPDASHPELLVFPEDANTRPMDQGPYMEISAGLDNILRCLRVDYVWRLSYRQTPYHIDRSGLRIALHVTF